MTSASRTVEMTSPPLERPATRSLARPGPVGLVIALAVLAELVVLALIPRLVTTDGAIHVGGAGLIRDLLTGAGDIHLHYVDITPYPVPNLTPELALAALMLVLDPGVAEKVLVAGYVILLPLGMLAAVRAAGARAPWLAVLAIPLTFSFTLQYGFYNFSYAVACALFVMAAALRLRERPTGRRAVVLGALLLVTYSCHLVPYAVALVFIAAVIGWDVLRALVETRGSLREVVRRHGRLVGLVVAAALPSLVLCVPFLILTRTGDPASYRPILVPFLGLLSFIWPLVTFDVREAVACIAMAGAVAVLTLWVIRRRWRERRWVDGTDGLALFTLATVGVFLVSPQGVASGGGILLERLALFPIYGIVLWLSAQDLPARLVRATAVVALVAAAGFVVLRMPAYLELSSRANDYLSVASCLAPGSTMLQANLYQVVPGPLRRQDPLIEETGVLSAATRGHDLGSVEGDVPFYPITNRPGNDPYVHLRTSGDLLYHIPPEIDLLGYEQRTDGRVDYLLLYGRSEADATVLASSRWTALRGQLEQGYRRVATSAAGHLEVFERDADDLRARGEAARAQAGSACPAVASDPFEGD